ncbi:MAG: response regulator [Candidatus Omnitrophota bacterium]
MIDDEADLCLMVKENLEETQKFIVVTTTQPETARNLVEQENPDLIFLDIVMPKMEGQQLIEQFKEEPKMCAIPIVVISGLGEMAYFKKGDKWRWLPNRPVVRERGRVIEEKNPEIAAQKYDVDTYIHKPFSTEALVQVMEEVLKEQKRKRERKQQEQENEERKQQGIG